MIFTCFFEVAKVSPKCRPPPPKTLETFFKFKVRIEAARLVPQVRYNDANDRKNRTHLRYTATHRIFIVYSAHSKSLCFFDYWYF